MRNKLKVVYFNEQGIAKVLINPQEIPEGAFVNPDLSRVKNLPPEFWKRVGDVIYPMDRFEKAEQIKRLDNKFIKVNTVIKEKIIEVPVIQEIIIEKLVEVPVIQEVIKEKIIEKLVEVPVVQEKIVEKLKEIPKYIIDEKIISSKFWMYMFILETILTTILFIIK